MAAVAQPFAVLFLVCKLGVFSPPLLVMDLFGWDKALVGQAAHA